MIPKNVEQLAKKIIKETSGKDCNIEKISTLGGGDINQSVRLKTDSGNFFMKYNKSGFYPQMFEKEAKGLNLLRATNEIAVPEVVGYDEDKDHTILILEYINSSSRKPSFWENFGKSLARMHNHSGENFGLDHDNFIGSLVQYNKPSDNWISFFVEQRLEKQIALAQDQNRIDSSTIKRFEVMYKYLEDFFPVEKPSLLHGDLWSGNFMVSAEGESCIIDPAVYYGHRLMDLGMSRLFGGFDTTFYKAYQEIHPLESNWREATEICNLYPLMVHVNLFGGGFLNSVKSILDSF